MPNDSRCHGFQYPLGGNDNLKKCNACGATTAHFGSHDMPNDDITALIADIDAKEYERRTQPCETTFEAYSVALRNGWPAIRAYIERLEGALGDAATIIELEQHRGCTGLSTCKFPDYEDGQWCDQACKWLERRATFARKEPIND